MHSRAHPSRRGASAPRRPATHAGLSRAAWKVWAPRGLFVAVLDEDTWGSACVYNEATDKSWGEPAVGSCVPADRRVAEG